MFDFAGEAQPISTKGTIEVGGERDPPFEGFFFETREKLRFVFAQGPANSALTKPL